MVRTDKVPYNHDIPQGIPQYLSDKLVISMLG
jgi:hypothetical protein